MNHGDSLGNTGHAGRGRRPVDDGRPRHPAPGNAAGRRTGPHARLSALGQPARVAQDDRRRAIRTSTANDIPEVTDDDGTSVRVIIGDFWGKRGPVEGIAADPRYLDVWVPPGKRKTHSRGARPLGVRVRLRRRRHVPRRVRSAGRDDRTHGRQRRRRTDGRRRSIARALRSRRRGHRPGGRTRHPLPARVRQAAARNRSRGTDRS